MTFKRNSRRISVGKSKLPPKEKKSKIEYDENELDGTSKESRFKIVSGQRRRNRKIRLITYGVILLMIIALIVVNFVTPTGLLESIQNGYSTFGGGKFPVDLYSINCTDFVTDKSVTAVINYTYLEIYNNRGKLIQAASHGLSNPRLEFSEARFLLFDRDRYSVKVYNYSSELYTREFEKTVVTADISRSGAYAVVTGADSYFATLYVYNKNNELLYTWNSAENYITDVAVSESGKSVAVSLLNASGGSFCSKIYILDFDSNAPRAKYEFGGLISSLRSVNKNYILASGIENAYVLPWNGTVHSDIGISGVIRNISHPLNGYVAVCYGRSSNETVNTVVVIDPKGHVGQPFRFNAKVTDIAVTENDVAVLSDTAVYIYDHKGTASGEISTEVKYGFIGLLSDGSLLASDNSSIVRLSVDKE